MEAARFGERFVMEVVPSMLLQIGGLSERLASAPPYVVALLVLGILMMTAGLIMRLRTRKRRTAATQITAREQLERAKQREGLKRDLEAIAVEIEDMARRVGAQLDNKAARLETLLDQADTAAARLEQARLALLQSPASSNDADAATPGPTAAAVGNGSADFSSDSSATRLAEDVARLHGQGMSAAEIGRAVSEDVGKVELILALRKAGPA